MCCYFQVICWNLCHPLFQILGILSTSRHSLTNSSIFRLPLLSSHRQNDRLPSLFFSKPRGPEPLAQLSFLSYSLSPPRIKEGSCLLFSSDSLPQIVLTENSLTTVTLKALPKLGTFPSYLNFCPDSQLLLNSAITSLTRFLNLHLVIVSRH